jgi:hypothetical protein
VCPRRGRLMIDMEKKEHRWFIGKLGGREERCSQGRIRIFEKIRENSNFLDVFLYFIECNNFRGSNNRMEETSMEEIST